MFSSFHAESQKVMSTAPVIVREPESSIVHISDMAGEFLQFFMMNLEQKRRYWLNIVQERRQRVNQEPCHEWGVYELCKAVYELAEIDHVDFNGASISEKMSFIRRLVPMVSSDALRYGVEEYHDSRARQGWTMSFLKSEGTEFIEGHV